MRNIKIFAILVILMLTGCGTTAQHDEYGVAATTAPVAQFAIYITEGTDIPVDQIVTDSVSCLHDYSLSVRQMETIENSRLLLISGAGLEDFMGDAIRAAGSVTDCSEGIELRDMRSHLHSEGKETHEKDPHIWLSPLRAAEMADNICRGLSDTYPEHKELFAKNTGSLKKQLEELDAYGKKELSDLSCREIITFHDGFSYLAEAFDLTILTSIEEEAGSEASASDLVDIIALVKDHSLPAVFTEKNGSDAAATVLSSETGVEIYTLDMAMGGSDYFEAMRHNIDTLKEALK